MSRLTSGVSFQLAFFRIYEQNLSFGSCMTIGFDVATIRARDFICCEKLRSELLRPMEGTYWNTMCSCRRFDLRWLG